MGHCSCGAGGFPVSFLQERFSDDDFAYILSYDAAGFKLKLGRREKFAAGVQHVLHLSYQKGRGKKKWRNGHSTVKIMLSHQHMGGWRFLYESYHPN